MGILAGNLRGIYRSHMCHAFVLQVTGNLGISLPHPHGDGDHTRDQWERPIHGRQ
jgi:hypothetical protein